MTIVGVTGQEADGWLAPVELQIGQYRWAAPAIFSPDVSPRPILGQAGFFAFFTVTFRYRQRELEIDGGLILKSRSTAVVNQCLSVSV